jgi:hypothetical protein
MTVLIMLVIGSSVLGLGAQLRGLLVGGGGLTLETALVGGSLLLSRRRLSRDGLGLAVAGLGLLKLSLLDQRVVAACGAATSLTLPARLSNNLSRASDA